MNRSSVSRFERPDGSVVICRKSASGKRLPIQIVSQSDAKDWDFNLAPRIAAPSPHRTDCLHIIEPTGDSVEQKNCGCPGNKMTSVWECELFGRVAPFAKGDPVDGVRACQKCGAYEKPFPPPPEEVN